MITSYSKEIDRLQKGVKIAWFVDFLIVWLTFMSAGIFIFLNTRSSNQEIINFIILDAIISGIISVIIVSIVSANANRILLSSPSGDHVKVENGQLYNIVEEMSIAAGLKKVPDIYVLEGSGVANAYATADSSGNTRVVCTNELCSLMNREELQSVIAHEIGHIVTGDAEAMTKITALTSTTALIAGSATRIFGFGNNSRDNNNSTNPIAIVLVVVSLLFLLVSPILSKIAESHMSRTRESRADAESVKFTRDPTGLAQALIKLDTGSRQLDQEDLESFSKKIGTMAFYDPQFMGIDFSTHPPIEERVKKLVEMGASI